MDGSQDQRESEQHIRTQPLSDYIAEIQHCMGQSGVDLSPADVQRLHKFFHKTKAQGVPASSVAKVIAAYETRKVR